MLGTLAKVFLAISRNNFVYSRKLDNMNHYHCMHYSLRATTSCRLEVRQENGTAHLPFPSYVAVATAKYHGLETHPCTCRWYCLTLLSEVSRNKLQMQQPRALRKIREKHFLFAKNGRLQIKEFRSTATYLSTLVGQKLCF
jgi:hypothetical protein